METVLDHLLHKLFEVRLKYWQVATHTTHNHLFSHLSHVRTADYAYMYCLFSPILIAATDGTTSGTKPTGNALGSNVINAILRNGSCFHRPDVWYNSQQSHYRKL